ncbi:DNA polymerase III subunit gamma and tau [Arthrobacter sp. KK5.5]|uniref:DNA polymerase III subunit gamma and tau n=1 Tax=Arthrobacter sp. KK5.5 TaxID=3373084 RepID=UPI003EE67A57
MSTALYRRYRPDTFADVIGQEHVTTPLMAALEKNRVNHAYLFSGPRGCGKTTSARILARCLNCEQGPTAAPCGACGSCVELATGGPGSLDVIEIDAASHGGVDDARDLRERATFAPVRDRYKIFIIDEAHMVTSAGFNALLKIVEEPPEHIKFIFATTEPDKVIGTIRSRTHHYPFRLVPPEPLMTYLERLSESEGVPVAPGVLSLVVRAGGGSVRDSLSVLDQLIAGAGPSGLDYELAVSLLGYTHASLLDDVVDAMAAQDAAVVFGAVDRVIQTGHDPRRFVEDLLERFRDLIIVKAMPDNAAQIIRGLPEDQLNRMRQQATQLGQAELSRSADVTNQALTEMTGATSPRLHLELLCARLLLPASDATERGINARIDRIDRRLAYAGDVPAASNALPTANWSDAGTAPASSGTSSGGGFESPREQGAAQVREALRSARKQDAGDPPEVAPRDVGDQNPTVAPAAPVAPAVAPVTAVATASSPAAVSPAEAPAAKSPAAAPGEAADASPDWGGNWCVVPEAESESDKPASVRSEPVATPPAPERGPTRDQPVPQTDEKVSGPVSEPASVQTPEPASAPPSPPASPSAPAAGSIEMFRRAWPEIMAALKEEKKYVWLTIQPHASLAGYDGRTLTVAFANPGPMRAFEGKPENVGLLQQSIHKVLGVKCEIVITAGGSAPAGGSGPKADRRPTPAAAVPTTNRIVDPTHGPVPTVEARAAEPVATAAPHRPAAPSSEPAPAAAAARWKAARQTETSRGPSRTASPPPSDDESPDFGPEPEDEGGYDWGADNVPVPDWEQPVPPSAAAPRPTGLAAAPAPAVRIPGAAAPAPGAVAPPPSDFQPMDSDSVSMPSPSPEASAPGAPAPAPASSGQKRMSRYQQLLSQARESGPPETRTQQPAAPSGQPGGPAASPGGGKPVESTYVEDVPSDDDIAIEESGVVGRPAIERILNGRLIEERNHDGSPVT